MSQGIRMEEGPDAFDTLRCLVHLRLVNKERTFEREFFRALGAAKGIHESALMDFLVYFKVMKAVERLAAPLILAGEAIAIQFMLLLLLVFNIGRVHAEMRRPSG